MQSSLELSEFGKIFLFMLLGISFILIGMAINALLNKPKPNPIKNSIYECGEVTEGPSRTPFNMRFYIIAIIFLLFDVELIFLFPWSTIFADKNLLSTIPNWGIFNMIEMSIFIFILLLGLAYVWRKGDLEWIRPNIQIPTSDTLIPKELYATINNQTYSIKEFKLIVKEEVEVSTPQVSTAPPSAARRAPFKSAVKKDTND